MINCTFVLSESEYANINFGPGILQHGSRYMVCVHARRVDIQQETWVQSLEEVNTCSDGVVVDLSSPTPGNVWIGHVPGMLYQVKSAIYSRIFNIPALL